MVELYNITKTFNQGKENQFAALKDISLTIEQNKITVLKGASGSGKTTLASLVGCMSRPTSGRIKINGRETTSLPERFLADIRRDNFGFIFQRFNLITGISVLENTLLPTYPMGVSSSRAREMAITLLEKLNIDSKIHQEVENLSSGEQQRVAIARALINAPLFIIADEPTAHLDQNMAVKFIDIVSKLQAEGKTLLIASHDPLLYDSEIVHRVIELKDGKLV
jgi:putative ABC transport system ATP-binding protein